MADKQISYNGTTHSFPGDFSDDEISSALAEYDKSSASASTQARGVGAEEGSGAMPTPGMEKLGGTPPAVGRPKLAMKKTMLIGGGSDAPDEQENESTGKSLANLGVGALKSGYGVSAPGILQSLTGAKTPAMVKKVAPWVDPVPKEELAGEVAMQGGLAMIGALEEGGARLPSRAVEGRAAATAEPVATGAARLAKSATPETAGPNVGLEIAKHLPVVGKYVRMADWGRKLLSPEPAAVPEPEVPAHWGQSNVGPVEMWGRSIPKGQERVTAGAPVARPAPAWQQAEAASKLQRAEPIPSNNFNGLKDAESADIKQQLEGQQESERAGADEIERKLFFMGNKPEGYTPKTLSLYDGQEKAIDVPLSKEEAEAIYKGQQGGRGGAPPDEPTSGGGGGEGRGGGSGSPGGNITPEPGQLKEGLKRVGDYTQPEPDDRSAGGGIIDRLKKFNKDEEGSMVLPGTDVFRRMKSGPMSGDTATPILRDMMKNSQAQRFFPKGLTGDYDPSDVLIDPEYKGIERFSPDEIRSMTPVQEYVNPAIVNRYMDAIREGGDVSGASVFKRFEDMPDPRQANAAMENDQTLLQMQPDYEPHITEDLTGRRVIMNGTHRSIASYKSGKPLDMSVYRESGELIPDSARPGAPGHEGVPASSEVPSSFIRELHGNSDQPSSVSRLRKRRR